LGRTICRKLKLCRWVSGLNHLTVNQALKSNAGSNPALHTKI